jgi:hypothetical protein
MDNGRNSPVPERYFNPFATIDLYVPTAFREDFSKYCQTSSKTLIDLSPFPRMGDLWFLAVCIAARKNLKPKDINSTDTYKIIDGSIFGSDPWRIQALMLLAIGISNDVEVVNDPRKMMSLANGLAIAGIPDVIEMLKDGESEPIWNLSDAIDEIFLRDEKL